VTTGDELVGPLSQEGQKQAHGGTRQRDWSTAAGVASYQLFTAILV